ncbi:hypothetical protein COCSADRAFT_222761 [Bipolaris sorokiniana ND90Pr]|uniref:Uncharacterized protein n=1 Tax=Cochliobolus sativus (strain ND90Pr / ATCC 201652) TaxID=665912 RepID=M2T0V7_COCSN|nr:uncharacterized protein COCSADRAFT_222761 [Bipolaris sorokiniana ND90Pr]EMD62637.1 hypothetical protein COCSADRAFT_222761 [Bipolaris sorokiniana ND90Pr]
MTFSIIPCTIRRRTFAFSWSFTIRIIGTYDHRKLGPLKPVRSSLVKQLTGGLVVRWVTTSESPLSYVFGVLYFLQTCGVFGLWGLHVGTKTFFEPTAHGW